MKEVYAVVTKVTPNTVRCHYDAVYLPTDIHKGQPIARPLVYFVDPASDWYSVSVPIVIYVISYDIGPRYYGTWLYQVSSRRSSRKIVAGLMKGCY